ncbi:hypothetical protein GGI42DRAFT_321803 [Trichoderma sp. SZMC 28013]
MEAINDEAYEDMFGPDPVELMKELQSEGGDESSHIDEEDTITEDTAEEESFKGNFSEEEPVPSLPNANGKRVASSMPPGDQPLDKRPRQSTAEEEFDIAKVVEAIEKSPPWKSSHKATLWNNLILLVEKVVFMEVKDREEGKKNKEFREEMRKYREEEKKHREEMKGYWEEDKNHREEEKKYWEEEKKYSEEEKKYSEEEKKFWEEIGKLMVAISKAFGVASQAKNQ